MADADEDVPIRQGPNDVDLSEEVQDYRFLSNLRVDDDHPTLPKRGEKDFEPNPTMHQRSTLDTSRQAMHDAISLPRVHQPKNHLVGYYASEGRSDACVVIENAHGTFFRTIGTADSKNRIWLLPEEALWLLERGSLDIRWPSHENDLTFPEGTPMSLQAAYATFICKSGLTLERYQVYAGLKRTGYIVQRAATWHENAVVPRAATISTTENSHSRLDGVFKFFHRVLTSIFASRPVGNASSGPLVAPGLYRSYSQIFAALSLIPFHQPEVSHRATSTPKPPFRLTFDVCKPSTPFKKSNPPEADFRIAVVDARSTQVPTLQEIGTLLDSMRDDPPPDKKMEIKLKHGHRNVLIAIVDTGIVSYLRFSDSVFGRQKVYEQKKQIGRKGGQRKNTAKSNRNPG